MVGGRPQSYRWRGWSVHVCDLQTLEATVGLGQMPVESMQMWLVWRCSLVGPSFSRASLQLAAHQPHLSITLLGRAPCSSSNQRRTASAAHTASPWRGYTLPSSSSPSWQPSPAHVSPCPSLLRSQIPIPTHSTPPYPSRAVRDTTRAGRQITN
jgi:hypothetical protein